MRKLICAVSALAVMLTGCSSYTVSDNQEYEPWNLYNIMENDKAIYTNLDFMAGWYMNANDESAVMGKIEKDAGMPQDKYHMWCHDRKTNYDMLLCSRPECPHDGRETCTATYHNLLNGSVRLYDDAIWFLAPDEIKGVISVSLYRTAGDGSSIDKVSELFSMKNDQPGERYWLEVTNMIIHKGYAYSTFELSCGVGGYEGFSGGGFVKTNLQTGKSTILHKYDDYFDKILQYEVCGDYIVYSKKDNLSHVVFHRLNINTLEDKTTEVENADNTDIITADRDNIYLKASAGNNRGVLMSYNPETDELSDTGINAPLYSEIMVYEGNTFILSAPRNSLVLDIYENETSEKLLSVKKMPDDDISHENTFFRPCISRGKLYFIQDAEKYEAYWSCPLEELISGNVNWTKEFDTDDMEQSYAEYALN